MTITASISGARVAEGNTARFYAKHEARWTAEAAAKQGHPSGVWLDSFGFVVSRLDRPVTRTDATLVLECR